MFPPVVLNAGSIRDDPNWTSRENSLELIEISSINKVSLTSFKFELIHCMCFDIDIRKCQKQILLLET